MGTAYKSAHKSSQEFEIINRAMKVFDSLEDESERKKCKEVLHELAPTLKSYSENLDRHESMIAGLVAGHIINVIVFTYALKIRRFLNEED